jgi:hypothetical protein
MTTKVVVFWQIDVSCCQIAVAIANLAEVKKLETQADTERLDLPQGGANASIVSRFPNLIQTNHLRTQRNHTKIAKLRVYL